MRGHGFTAVGSTIEEAVYRSIYTCTNARVQTTSLLLQAGYNTGLLGEKLNKLAASVGSGGKDGAAAGGGGDKGPQLEGIKFLSERECKDAWEANKTQASRPWGLWCKEVEGSALYRNEFLEVEVEEEGDGYGDGEE